MFDEICVSIQGSSHIKNNIVCQDYADTYCKNEDYAIAAIADGHGSKKHFRSDKGSQFAVKVSIDTINEYMEDKEKFFESYKRNAKYILDRIKKVIITRWTMEVENDLNENPISDEEKIKYLDGVYDDNKKISIYGTTLLVAFMSEECNFGLVIGDGCFVVINEEGKPYIPIEDSESGANFTSSISSFNAFDNFKYWLFDEKPFAILLSTDGLIKTFSSQDDFLDYNQTIVMEICKIKNEDIKEDLKSRLKDVFKKRSENGSEDDISLSVIYCKDKIESMSKTILSIQEANNLNK